MFARSVSNTERFSKKTHLVMAATDDVDIAPRRSEQQ